MAVSSARFAALRAIAAAGIPAGVWINPALPFLTDTEENLLSLLRLSKQSGASYVITHLGMTLREGNREYFYAALDRHFPGLSRRYAEAFGNAYFLPSPNGRRLHRVFKEECARLGLACTFREANGIIQSSGGFAQQSLL